MKPTRKDWINCASALADKLRRFQSKGYLASHDKDLAFYEQCMAKEMNTKRNSILKSTGPI